MNLCACSIQILRGGDLIEKVKCPYCGYEMPIAHDKDAVCKGVFVKCKGRQCKKTFEIKLNVKKEVK